MEIDEKLKNRLAGTAVVTVLAIIFLPMMFDDPVVKKKQIVSEIEIPHKPEVSPLLTTTIVDNKPEVTADANAEPVDDLAETPEKLSEGVSVDSDKALADDPELTTTEEETLTEPAKKPVKKATVVAKHSDKPAEELKPIKPKEPKEPKKVAEEKKSVKAKIEKKPTKLTPPVLEVKAEEKKPATTEPKTTAHRWMVQVVSLNDQTKALAFRDKLRAQGFPATVDSAWIKGKGRVYRLKVGPELDAQKAQTTKAKINQLNKASSFVISE